MTEEIAQRMKTEECQHFNLLLIGLDNNKIKSLVHQFINDKDNYIDKDTSFIFCDIPKEKINFENKIIQLRIEIVSCESPTFHGQIEEIDGLIFFYSITSSSDYEKMKSDFIARFHKNQIKKRDLERAYFIVGIDSEKNDQRQVQQSDAEAFSKECQCNFIEISSDGSNNENLFNKITRDMIAIRLEYNFNKFQSNGSSSKKNGKCEII